MVLKRFRPSLADVIAATTTGRGVDVIIDFVGEGFYFDYDSFKIDLTDLAAATINVANGETDKDGDPIYIPLRSKIEGLTGYLNISQPDNKAGKKPALQYTVAQTATRSPSTTTLAIILCYSTGKIMFERIPK